MFNIEVNVFLIQNKYFSAFHSYAEKKSTPIQALFFHVCPSHQTENHLLHSLKRSPYS